MTKKNAPAGQGEGVTIQRTRKNGSDMSISDTTDTRQEWNRPEWDRDFTVGGNPRSISERVEEKTDGSGELIIWASECLVDGPEVSVDITREDVRTVDGEVSEGALQINVWAGGNQGFVAHSPQDLLRAADDLRTAAREAAILLSQAEGRDTFEFTSRYIGQLPEHHIVRYVSSDGSEEISHLRFPSSNPSGRHWHPADVAEPGQWWHLPNSEPALRAVYVCRVRRIDGFEDLWEQVDGAPLEGYEGDLPCDSDEFESPAVTA